MRLLSLYRKSPRDKSRTKIFCNCFSTQCSPITLITFARHAWIATTMRKRTIAMLVILAWINFNFILSFVLILTIRVSGMHINFGYSILCGAWWIELLTIKELLMRIRKGYHNPTFGYIWQSFMIWYIKWIYLWQPSWSFLLDIPYSKQPSACSYLVWPSWTELINKQFEVRIIHIFIQYLEIKQVN